MRGVESGGREVTLPEELPRPESKAMLGTGADARHC
jgi:hypothetical protein